MSIKPNDKKKNQEIQPVKQDSQIVEIGKNISSMSKESLKSLLYLVAGKQDSNFRFFYRPVFLDADDMIDLNERIQEKFSHYETTGIVTVDIMYNKNRAMHFGTWAEFESHNWKTSKRIKSLSIKWDFMLTMPEYPIQQRHTLSVKFVSGFDPIHFLHAMTSSDPSDQNEIEFGAAPIIARVDFISHLLSDELLNIVEEWIKSREVADFIQPWYKWIRSKRRYFSRFSHYSLPTLIAIISLGVINYFNNYFGVNDPINTKTLTYMMYWILGSGFLIPGFSILGGFLGRKTAYSLEDFNRHSLFTITSGDKTYQDKLGKKNKKAFRGFIGYSCWTLILNIIAGIISYKIFTS